MLLGPQLERWQNLECNQSHAFVGLWAETYMTQIWQEILIFDLYSSYSLKTIEISCGAKIKYSRTSTNGHLFLSRRTVHTNLSTTATASKVRSSCQSNPLHNGQLINEIYIQNSPIFIVNGHVYWGNESRNELLEVPNISDERRPLLLRKTKLAQTDELSFTSFCFVNIFLLNIIFCFYWYIFFDCVT